MSLATPTFLTDTFVTTEQGFSLFATAELANGNFIKVGVQDKRLVGQFYNPDGTKDGRLFTMTAQEQDFNSFRAVTGLADGGFVVAWGVDADVPSVGLPSQVDQKYRVFEADGSARSAIFDLHPTSDANDFDVTLTAAGDGFVAAWRSSSDNPAGDRFDQGVLHRFFDSNGQPQGPEKWLNEERNGYQNQATSATLSDGSIVVAYTTDFNNNLDVLAQVLDPNGNVIVPEFTANSVTLGRQTYPSVTALADGRFAIALVSDTFTGSDLFARIFSLDKSGAGVKVVEDSPIIQLNDKLTENFEALPKIAGIAGGGFFAAWLVDLPSTPGELVESIITGRFFKPDGTPEGESFEIYKGKLSTLRLIDVDESDQGGIMVSWIGLQESAPGSGGFTSARMARVIEAPVDAASVDKVLKGTGAADVLTGGAGNDKISGRGGPDEIKAGAGDDVIQGGSGSDDIDGQRGDDVIDGGKGNDKIDGGVGNDTIKGGAGRDRLIGDDGNDTIDGGAGNDRISGGEGRDILEGGGGRDKISGGAGRDTLDGGRGSDTLTGGGGPDTFVFARGYDKDRITDISDADTIRLDAGLNGLNLTAREFIQAYAVETPDGVLFSFGQGDQLLVQNVTDRFTLVDTIDFF